MQKSIHIQRVQLNKFSQDEHTCITSIQNITSSQKHPNALCQSPHPLTIMMALDYVAQIDG